MEVTLQLALRPSLRVIGLAMVGSCRCRSCGSPPAPSSRAATLYRQADERLTRTADVLHEQALKVLENTDVVLENLLEHDGGLSDASIRADLPRWGSRAEGHGGPAAAVAVDLDHGADGRIVATDYADPCRDRCRTARLFPRPAPA